jgi:hypothetical protein
MLFDLIPMFRDPLFIDDGRMTWEFYGLVAFVLLSVFLVVFLDSVTEDPASPILVGILVGMVSFMLGSLLLLAPGLFVLGIIFIATIFLAEWLGVWKSGGEEG